MCDSLIESSLHGEQPRKLIPGKGQVGIQLQGAIQFAVTGRPVVIRGQGEGEREVRIREIWIQGDGFLSGVLFFDPRLLAWHEASAEKAVVVRQAAIRQRVTWIQLNGLVESLNGIGPSRLGRLAEMVEVKSRRAVLFLVVVVVVSFSLRTLFL